jgi:hypothetical protein
MRWTGQIFWLLAYVPTSAGITFFPPSPPKGFGDWPNWKVVSSYSSATAPDSHGISCADPLFQARKELDREVAACARRCKTFSQLSSSGRDKPPAKSDNRAVGRQRYFLFGESLKDRIAFLRRSDRAGDVPKIISRALSNDAA